MVEAKNTMLRQRALENSLQQRADREYALKDNQDRRNKRWLSKTKNSPFAVNLIAEDERVTEETRARNNDQKAEVRDVEERREKAKNGIILRVRIS